MPGALFHQLAVATCPHGGQVTTIPVAPRVTVMGMPVATVGDQFLVAGCAFTVGPKPQPCVMVRWTTPAARLKILGLAVVLTPAPSLCLSADQIPAGPAMVLSVQPRVTGM
jgi:hypothetical protein